MIRLATADDTAAVRQLWDRCFADEGGFNGYFFAHLYHHEHTLLWEQEGKLCAMVQMLPRTMLLDGESHTATYIYGACTDPDHRRKGLMAKLLAHSFALDRENGRAASFLIPQEAWLFDFYRPFGYMPSFCVERGVWMRQGTANAPRRLTKEDIPALDACYRRALHTDCAVMRSHAEWEEQLAMFNALGAGAYGWFEEETLTAYAFCWADNTQEAVGVSQAQAQGLLDALQVDRLPWTGMGSAQPLGCLKRYQASGAEATGYINLLLN